MHERESVARSHREGSILGPDNNGVRGMAHHLDWPDPIVVRAFPSKFSELCLEIPDTTNPP